MKKVCGIGINDADYQTSKYDERHKLIWRCPIYTLWFNMISRCYRNGGLGQYVKTVVCDDWHRFSVFKSWVEKQDWEGTQLDKDIYGDGKLYSPNTCCFVTAKVNTLITEDRKNNKSGIPCISFKNNSYNVNVSNGEGVVSKSFHQRNDAINFWIDTKISAVRMVCEQGELQDKLLSRYEELRVKFLNDETTPLRKLEKIPAFAIQVGDTFSTKSGEIFKILKIINSKKILIEFESGDIKWTRKDSIRRRTVKPVKSFIKSVPSKIITAVKRIRVRKENGLLHGVVPSGKYYCVHYKDTNNRVSKYFKELSIAEEFMLSVRYKELSTLAALLGVTEDSVNVLLSMPIGELL